jgi:hypothetical protein
MDRWTSRLLELRPLTLSGTEINFQRELNRKVSRTVAGIATKDSNRQINGIGMEQFGVVAAASQLRTIRLPPSNQNADTMFDEGR